VDRPILIRLPFTPPIAGGALVQIARSSGLE